jgi:phospholipase/lecithinase/hemolysin
MAMKMVILSIAFFVAISTIGANAYDRIYAFGDSLSDTGNVPAPAPDYFGGRYSNGKLWIEYLSLKLGLSYQPTNNHAQADSPTATVLQQTKDFSPSGELKDSLFVLWGGGVDFINAAPIGFNDAAWADVVNGAINNLSNAATVLIAKGALTIVIPNVIDMTRSPGGSVLPSIYKPYARNKLIGFNNSLAATLQTLSVRNPQTRIIPMDLWTQFNDLLDHPRSYGFTKVDIGVLQDDALPDKSFNGPGQTYLFWDEIHPTSRAHAVLSGWFETAIVQPLQFQVELKIEGPALQAGHLRIGKIYQILATPDFKSWEVLTSFTAGSPDFELTNLGPRVGSKFFRLVQQD